VRIAHVVLVLGAQFVAGCSDLCGNEQLTQHESPSGDFKVVVFQRSCGATTGYSVHGSVLESDEELRNGPGNLFVVGEDAYGRPSIDWIGDRELKLSYSPGLDIRVIEDGRRGVTVTIDDGR
jgi:hypothetical protein